LPVVRAFYFIIWVLFFWLGPRQAVCRPAADCWKIAQDCCKICGQESWRTIVDNKKRRYVKIVGGIGVVKLLCAIGQFEDLIAAFGSSGRSDS
jgi:hypothetical protein